MKYYTGVGSRETPEDILELMKTLAYKLASDGYILRSGGADGADKSFQDGWWDNYQDTRHEHGRPEAEIYIAWGGFNGLKLGMYGDSIVIPSGALAEKAFDIAASIHPAWDKCSHGAKTLHSRNVFQVLGRDLKTPSKMLIAWTKLTRAGEPTGGTATAIRLAEKHNIPCFNLNRVDDLARILKYLED